MNAAAPGRTFGYSRVSRDDLTGENQKLEIERAGHVIPATRFLSDTTSGLIPAAQRPSFAKLLDRLEAGDRLVVSRLDRLGRDLIDVESTLRMLQAKGVAVIVLQLGAVDLNSTAGKLIRGVLSVVAAMERDLLAERTRAGLARAKAQGRRIGRPPKTSAAQKADLRMRAEDNESISSLARRFKISRATVLEVIRAGTIKGKV